MRGGTRSINCPSCGAGQSVLGGGRVQSAICIFCGATLDAAKGFEAIGDKVALVWPETPLEIGMTGKIAGVEATVIGILEMVERRAEDGEIGWRWVDHQIYSPTHGYAWLTWEDGWLTFSRKSRMAPIPSRISGVAIETSDSPPTARFEGETFTYYDSGVSEIAFAAGAFNYTPQRGQRSYVVNALGDRRMLSFVETEGPDGELKETEWEITELLDRRETLASFGVDASSLPTAKGGVHALTPFKRAPIWNDVRDLALLAGVFCLAAGLAFSFLSSGVTVAQTEWSSLKKPLTIDFEVTDPDRLVAIHVDADVDNAWAWFDLEVTDEEDETVFEVERGVEYYHGYDDGSWSEGSRRSSVYFRLPEAGRYRAEASLSEQGVWSNPRGSRPVRRARLSAAESISSGFPLLIAAPFFALIAGALIAQRAIHKARRWRGGDWSDD